MFTIPTRLTITDSARSAKSRFRRLLIGFSKFDLNWSRVCTFASAKLATSFFSVTVFASLTPPGVLISTISSRGRGTSRSKSFVEIVALAKGDPPLGCL